MIDRTGQFIDDYRLVGRLGAGAFGEVYLGEHIHDQSRVAVKVLQLTQENLKGFIKETSTTFRLRHPHIMKLISFGMSADDTPYLIMDYASNGTLRDRHPKGTSLSLDIIRSYVMPLAAALQYAHGRRVVHRDVKPENVLIGSAGEILLSDFGIAVVAPIERSLSTQNLGGTVPYMAPEQIRGKPQPASDQYALGIMVYEWLCGVRPFQGTQWRILEQQRSSPPPPLREKCPNLPVQVEEIVLKALAKNPQDRFICIQDFATALAEVSQASCFSLSTLPLPPSSPQKSPAQPVTSQGQVPLPSSAPVQEKAAMHSLAQESFAEIDQSPILSSPVPFPSRMDIPSSLSSASPLPDQSATFISPSYIARSSQSTPPLPTHPTVRRSMVPRNLLLAILILLVIGGGTMSYSLATGQWKFSWIVQHMPIISEITGTANISLTTTPKITITPPVNSYERWGQTYGIMFGFDAQHTHFNPYESILGLANVSQLTQKWLSDPIGGNTFSSPVVIGSTAYVGSTQGRLYAFDAATGHTRWISDEGSDSSTPAIINDIVYTSSYDGRLYAFDAATGHTRWTSSYNDMAASSPTVTNGSVYVTGFEGVYAFDTATGHSRWVFPISSPSRIQSTAVAVANGLVYASVTGSGPGQGRVYALNATTGKTRWISDLIEGGIDVNSSPAVANGMVYVGSGSGGLAAFDATTGHVRWVTAATAGSTGASPAVADGIVYLPEDRMYAFDATSGHTRWISDSIGAFNNDSPFVANGVVYVCSAGNDSVYALAAATGSKLWVSPPTKGQLFTTPEVANGVVYIASNDSDGKLYAFHLP